MEQSISKSILTASWKFFSNYVTTITLLFVIYRAERHTRWFSLLQNKVKFSSLFLVTAESKPHTTKADLQHL